MPINLTSTTAATSTSAGSTTTATAASVARFDGSTGGRQNPKTSLGTEDQWLLAAVMPTDCNHIHHSVLDLSNLRLLVRLNPSQKTPKF